MRGLSEKKRDFAGAKCVSEAANITCLMHDAYLRRVYSELNISVSLPSSPIVYREKEW